jgi:hypothetical protein
MHLLYTERWQIYSSRKTEPVAGGRWPMDESYFDRWSYARTLMSEHCW